MLLWSHESVRVFIRTKILSCEFRIPCALVVIFYIGIAARTRRIHVQLLTFGILMPLCQWLERYLLQCGVENNYVFWHRRLFSVQYHTAKRVFLWGSLISYCGAFTVSWKKVEVTILFLLISFVTKSNIQFWATKVMELGICLNKSMEWEERIHWKTNKTLCIDIFKLNFGSIGVNTFLIPI